MANAQFLAQSGNPLVERRVEGKPIDKGLIYKILNNRTYLGELRHKELWYQAEHPPIITHSVWEDVRAILSTNGRVRATTTRAKTQYLLILGQQKRTCFTNLTQGNQY